MLLLKIMFVKRILIHELIGQGYSHTQAEDIVYNEIGDGRILAWIKKWGPTILEILLIVLPLIMSNSRHIPLGRKLITLTQVNNLNLPTAQEIWNTND